MASIGSRGRDHNDLKKLVKVRRPRRSDATECYFRCANLETAHTCPRDMGLADEAAAAVEQQLRSFGLRLDAFRCPQELQGTWRVDKASSASLCPFVVGLGVPKFVCPAIGVLERTTVLTIKCVSDANNQNTSIRITDKTALSSKNVTQVTLDGVETRKKSKTGRKEFYLSGNLKEEQGQKTSIVTCRLCRRGDGWQTRQERKLINPDTLHERNVLCRPGEEDIAVDRFFKRVVDGKGGGA